MGGIYNTGILTIATSSLTNNLAAGGGGGGGGGVYRSVGGFAVGALYNESVPITEFVFSPAQVNLDSSTRNAASGNVGAGGASGEGLGDPYAVQSYANFASIASWVNFATITSATYDAAAGVLAVTAKDMFYSVTTGSLTLTGRNGSTYQLTSPDVYLSSGTAAVVILNAADKLVVNGLLNNNGTSSANGTSYNLAAVAGWTSGASAADLTGNPITVSNVSAPSITSATYHATSGALVVTGTGLVNISGSTNDITANKLTLTGEGGATYTLTDTANVDITSGTRFTLTLSATDRAGVNLNLNKNGTSSTGATTYNLAAADDWNSDITGSTIADLTSNGITVSAVARPTITSATYNASTGVVVVTGTGFLARSGCVGTGFLDTRQSLIRRLKG